MFSFYTIWTRFQISVFNTIWLLLRFCYTCLLRRSAGFFFFDLSTVKKLCRYRIGLEYMVGKMVQMQNSQSLLYSFTFNAFIVIHEYYSPSITEFTFKKYVYSHLTVYFLFIIFAHIYEISSFTFSAFRSPSPGIFIHIHDRNFLRTTFAHH